MAKGLIQNVTWRSTILLLLETCLIVGAIAAGAASTIADASNAQAPPDMNSGLMTLPMPTSFMIFLPPPRSRGY